MIHNVNKNTNNRDGKNKLSFFFLLRATLRNLSSSKTFSLKKKKKKKKKIHSSSADAEKNVASTHSSPCVLAQSLSWNLARLLGSLAEVPRGPFSWR